jgi:hypothetical protein
MRLFFIYKPVMSVLALNIERNVINLPVVSGNKAGNGTGAKKV